MEDYSFKYNNEEYLIKVVKDSKLKRNMRLAEIDGDIYFRVPPYTSSFYIKRTIKSNAPMIVDFIRRHHTNKNTIFIFGQEYEIESVEGKNKVSNFLYYEDKEELEEKLTRMFKDYVEGRFRYYEHLMGIENRYKLTFKKTATRYGSNSRKTHRICLSTNLVHYSKEIIDSVIVHELVHDHHFDHSKDFYEEVYRFCPNYKKLRAKMKKGEYA